MLTILKFCTLVILIVDYMSLKCNLVLVNNVVMPICMASHMMTGYGHANHAFRVNVRF
jgi:hypothetical protein